MFLYLILFLAVSVLIKFIKKEKFNYIDFVLIFFMIAIAGFRDGIGTDYNMYKSFYFYPDQIAAKKVEWGFIELIKISQNMFGERYYLFFLICSILTILPIYYIFKEKSSYPAFSLLLFISLGFYTLSFNMVRQCIAIAIAFYALKYIEERKLIKYCFFIGVACLFHMTALIMLPMYFLANIEIKKSTLKKFFVISLFAGILFNPIFSYVVNHIPQYEMYRTYNSVEAGIGTYLVDLIYLLMIWFVISKKETIIKSKFEGICLNISVLAVPMIVFSLKNILFARMIYYFFIPILIPFANTLKFFNVKLTQRVYNYTIVIGLLIIYVLNIIAFNGVYPYASIFNL